MIHDEPLDLDRLCTCGVVTFIDFIHCVFAFRLDKLGTVVDFPFGNNNKAFRQWAIDHPEYVPQVGSGVPVGIPGKVLAAKYFSRLVW